MNFEKQAKAGGIKNNLSNPSSPSSLIPRREDI
jgi:hypothetical protein